MRRTRPQKARHRDMARRARARRRPASIDLAASRFRLPAVLLGLAVVYGTLGYHFVEDYSLLDALYMTVTTLSTVGFGEVRPLSPAGRVFTMTLIAFGVVAVFALVGAFTTLLASGELGRSWQRRHMRRRIDALNGHYIVCAYGRVGMAAAHELLDEGADVVVVESKPDLEVALEETGMPYVMGDPADDSVLEAAGVRHAKGLVCAVDSDAINVFITLTARALNPALFIISRASRPESVEKLMRAGSDRVVSPYVVSGARMATLALRPAMLEFVDMVSVAPDLRVEELAVGPGSPLAHTSVQEACMPYDGVFLLALRKPEGQVYVPPPADTELETGDVLIAVGPARALAALSDAAG